MSELTRMLRDLAQEVGAVACRHCAEGARHRVGNCVLCGCGPAPGAEDLPPVDDDRQRLGAMARLYTQLWDEARGRRR